jgi:hypothetical protein
MQPMKTYTLIGHRVIRTVFPRFELVMEPSDDGTWRSGSITLIDPPPDASEVNARDFAKMMREAGDHFAEHWQEDWLQSVVIDRAKELGLTAYAIAKLTGWAVSEDHVQAYLTRRKSMGSHKLQHVLAALGQVVVKA